MGLEGRRMYEDNTLTEKKLSSLLLLLGAVIQETHILWSLSRIPRENHGQESLGRGGKGKGLYQGTERKHKWEIKKFLNLNFPLSIMGSCFVSIVAALFCFGWSCFTRISHRNL